MDLLKRKVTTSLALGLNIDTIIQALLEDPEIQEAKLVASVTAEKINKVIKEILIELKEKYNPDNIGNNLYIELLKFDYLYQELLKRGEFKEAAQIHVQKLQLMKQANLLPNNE